MPKSIEKLERFKEISFIIGSGPSLDEFYPGFIDKLHEMGTVLGVNSVAERFHCDYNVRKSFSKEGVVPSEVPKYKFANEDCMLIISEYDCGVISQSNCNSRLDGDYFFFEHTQNRGPWALEMPEPEGNRIIASWSTITSAMHVAAKMGTSHIIIIGHDLSKGNFFQYYKSKRKGPAYWKFRGQTIRVKEYLEREYGVSVSILTPYIGVGRISKKLPRFFEAKVKISELIREFPKHLRIQIMKRLRGNY